MTVKELIEILENFSEDAIVVMNGYEEVEDVDDLVDDETCVEYARLR